MNEITANGIRRILKRRKLRQAHVAEMAGFTKQQFNDMLQGRKVIRADYLPRIAAALGVEPGEIFSETVEKTERVISPLYHKLTVEDAETGKEIAVVTAGTITTAADNIVVRLTPKRD